MPGFTPPPSHAVGPTTTDNLSLTRTATAILGQGARRMIGVGRASRRRPWPSYASASWKSATLCRSPNSEVVATAKVAGGQFQMRHAPQDRIVRREIAQEIADTARGFEGALAVRVKDKRQGPPKLHDLPSLQKLCGSRFKLAGQQERPAWPRRACRRICGCLGRHRYRYRCWR